MATPPPAASSKDKDSDAPSSPKFASRPPSGADSYGPLSDNGLENVDLGLSNEEIDLSGGGSSSAAAAAAAVDDRGNIFSSAAASSSSAAAGAGVSTRPTARIRISVSDPVKRVSVRIIDGKEKTSFLFLRQKLKLYCPLCRTIHSFLD